MPLPVFSPSKLPTPKHASTSPSSLPRRSIPAPAASPSPIDPNGGTSPGRYGARTPGSRPGSNTGAATMPTPRADSATGSAAGSAAGSTVGRKISGESVRSVRSFRSFVTTGTGATSSIGGGGVSRRGRDVDDKSKMPPPALPGSRRSGKEAEADRESIKEKEKGVVKKKSTGLGRVGSVLKRSGTVKEKEKEKEREKEKEKEKGKEKDKEREKEKVKEKAAPAPAKPEEKKHIGFMGRLRAGKVGTSSTVDKDKEKDKKEGLERSKSVSTRSSALGTLRSSRPTSMVAPSTGTQASRRPPTAAERPTTSSSSRAPTSASTGLHRRNPSTTSLAQNTATTATTASARPTTASTARPTTASTTAPKSKRPAFSTLKQSFTPKKPAAPPPPTQQAPPPPSPEVLAAQTQLLQYTCLYAASHATYAQLTASATAKLQTRFETLAKKHAETRRKITIKQRRASLASLAAVVETPALGAVGKKRETLKPPEEKIQRFSEAITRLEGLMQNEQRVLTRAFEEWITGYAPPSSNSIPSGGANGYIAAREKWIQGLGSGWRQQCTRVGRGIQESVDAIQAVVAAVMASSGGMDDAEAGVVGVVAEKWLEVARGMWEEMEGMWRVEESIVVREREGVRDIARGVVDRTRIDMGREDARWSRGIWA